VLGEEVGAQSGISAPDSCNSSLPARPAGSGCLKCIHRQRTCSQEPQLITAYFTFVTVSFFAAIAANVAASIAGAHA